MRRDPYLWDRSGPVDPEIERLEELLSDFRSVPGDTPAGGATRGPRLPQRLLPWMAAAAAVVLVALSLRFWRADPTLPLTLEESYGPVLVDGRPYALGSFDEGALIEVGQEGRALVRLGDRGRFRLEGPARMTVFRAREGGSLLELHLGRLQARIRAAPREMVFLTPGPTLVDLGCAFETRVTAAGDGDLEVTEGWVGVLAGAEETWVPAGFRTVFTAEDPGVPLPTDGALEDSPMPSPVLHRLAEQPPLTLWHLARRVQGEERHLVLEHLARRVPPPVPSAPDRLLGASLDDPLWTDWWRALGQDRRRWWNPEGPRPTALP